MAVIRKQIQYHYGLHNLHWYCAAVGVRVMEFWANSYYCFLAPCLFEPSALQEPFDAALCFQNNYRHPEFIPWIIFTTAVVSAVLSTILFSTSCCKRIFKIVIIIWSLLCSATPSLIDPSWYCSCHIKLLIFTLHGVRFFFIPAKYVPALPFWPLTQFEQPPKQP